MTLPSLESEAAFVIALEESKKGLWNNWTTSTLNQMLEQKFNALKNRRKHPNEWHESLGSKESQWNCKNECKKTNY